MKIFGRGARGRLVIALATATGVLLAPAVASAAGQLDLGEGAQRSLTVRTTGGTLRGVQRTNITQWLGIPYAAAPVGPNRWRAPQPIARWSGVRAAGTFGNRCAQGTGWDPGYENPIVSEDCLYLNVYAPRHKQDNLPVMVWVHGGGFSGGAGQDTDPRKFIDNSGVVFVTINYRLGALGYLNLPQLRAEGADGPGNFGLLDQQMALRWVKDNIDKFGGDAQNVTVAGQSAGGSSVCDQMASPTATGLFQRAIIMSGGCGMSTVAAGDTSGAAFATAAGCTDQATLLACLRALSPQAIVTTQATNRVGPSIGGAAFPVDPAAAIASGNFTRVPVMNGQTHDEARLGLSGVTMTAAEYEATIRSTYGVNADRILAAYPASAYVSPVIALATVRSDMGSYTRQRLDEQLSRYVPTFAYEFAEEDTPQFASIYLQQQKGGPLASFPFGATHVDDLPYLWEYLGMTLPFDDDELELSDQMIRYWSQFMGKGNPNSKFVPRWPNYAQRQVWMELVACDTSPASNQPPAACSRASRAFRADHRTGLWASVLGT